MSNSSKKDQANFSAALLALSLDRNGAAPLHAQLAGALRGFILEGRAPQGTRLPPSRLLAQELSISRATVLAALEQLAAEGYLQGRQGAGVQVAETLPHLVPPRAPARSIQSPAPLQDVVPFHPGVPEMRIFPYPAWARHLEAAWRNPQPDLLKLPDKLGWAPLRGTIAAHLRAWRGIEASVEQIIITSGSQEAFGLIADLLGRGREVFVEDPCFAPMRARLEAAGISCLPIRVDEEGLDPALLSRPAAGVVVTPSRQYPLGMTLPAARRLALLQWAEQSGAFIIEDDYDSEFRFTGTPLPALASLDKNQRPIYIGSFSKLLSPTLRLGYVVLPRRLLGRLDGWAGTQASLLPQPALAAFMASGEFAMHLRRMRRLYARRQAVLLAEIEAQLRGWLVPWVQPSGMHITCGLTPRGERLGDVALSGLARQAGLILRPLSPYFHTHPARQGVLMGFAAFDEESIRAGISRLAATLAAAG